MLIRATDIRGAMRCVALALPGVLLAACASGPQLDAQWSDPSLGSHSGLLRGAKVLVACDTFDIAVRQICQQEFAAELVARGASPVLLSPDSRLVSDRTLDSQILPSAVAADAKAVLVVTLAPASTDAGSGFSIGLGGFGFGRGGGGGVGVEAPLGGGRITTGYGAHARVTDVATGRMAWAASAAATPSADLPAQIGALSRTVLDSAAKAGLF